MREENGMKERKEKRNEKYGRGKEITHTKKEGGRGKGKEGREVRGEKEGQEEEEDERKGVKINGKNETERRN